MADQEGDGNGAVAALRASDPVLARLIDGLEPVDFSSWRARWALDRFRALARAIVGQQIATRAATAIFDRLQSLIGHRDPAAAIVDASDADLRSVGLSAAKAASLRDLAARTLDGRLHLEGLDELTDDEARAQLTAVRGIGPWTADMFLLGQLANLLFSYELQPRLSAGGSSLLAMAVHPGMVRTNLFGHRRGLGSIIDFIGRFAMQDPTHAARATLFAATQDIPGGSFVQPGGFGHLRGTPAISIAAPSAYDATVAGDLWAISARPTGTERASPMT